MKRFLLHFSWADLKRCLHWEEREPFTTISPFTASNIPALTAAARFGRYSLVLLSILVDIRRRSWALKLKHPYYKSSGMALLSQTITRYSCKVSVGKENFQEAILVPSACFGVSESLTVRIRIFPRFLASVLETGPRRF